MQRANPQRLELESKICEIENVLTSLKLKLQKVEAEEQHQAIDHLEDCLEEVDARFSNLKDFGHLLLLDAKRVFGQHR